MTAGLGGVQTAHEVIAPDAERGFSMVEVVVAVTLLALLAVGFMITTGNSLELTGAAKERQTATQVVVTAIEEGRAVPYDSLALDSASVFEGGTTPDRNVVDGGTRYGGEAGTEVLLVGSGGLSHRDSVDISGVSFEIYRYVTRVVDPAAPTAKKRLTVAVVHGGAAHNGTGDEVVLSSVIGRASVAFVSTTSSSTTTPPSTTTSSTTSTTTNPGACTGDTTPPAATMSILAGTGANQGYTGSQAVSLSLTASDPCLPLTMAFSNNGTVYSQPVPFSTSTVHSLTSGDGLKTLSMRLADGAGNTRVVTGTIKLDTTLPSTPGSFTVTGQSQGTRKATISWATSTDNDLLVGYRLFRAVNSGVATSLAPDVTSCSTTCSIVDNNVKNKTTYTYYVVSFDAAGNQSVKTVAKSHTF